MEIEKKVNIKFKCLCKANTSGNLEGLYKRIRSVE